MSEQTKDFLRAAGFAMGLIFFALLLLNACDGGWAIAGWEVK